MGGSPSRRQLQQDTFDVLQPPVVIARTQAAHIALEIILIAQQAVKTSSKQTQLARQMAHGMNGGGNHDKDRRTENQGNRWRSSKRVQQHTATSLVENRLAGAGDL